MSSQKGPGARGPGQDSPCPASRAQRPRGRTLVESVRVPGAPPELGPCGAGWALGVVLAVSAGFGGILPVMGVASDRAPGW